jgi:radical SAM superfamily enzyme YgiQ (UPF0313 family)
MEARIRERELPLWSWESKTPLVDFDCVGFTLQYEMCYTTVLNMLDLAGIPLRSEDRDERHPLIIAGGTCAFNPEPLADFIDAFVIGDGEEVIVEIVAVLRGTKGRPRDERLRALEEQARRLADRGEGCGRAALLLRRAEDRQRFGDRARATERLDARAAQRVPGTLAGDAIQPALGRAPGLAHHLA